MALSSALSTAIRSSLSGSLGGGASLLATATAYLAGNEPDHFWDFVNDRALFSGSDVGSIEDTPNWSFTRASGGYAETEAGELVWFASGEPRITDKGLLVEGAATNYLTYSQDLSNAAWFNSNVTVTGGETAPDGTSTAQRLTVATTSSASLYQNQTTISTTAATYSVYAKKGSGAEDANIFLVRNVTTATNLIAGTLNYDTGVWSYVTGSSGVTIQTLANGWYRIIISVSSGITAGDDLRMYVGFTGGSQTAGIYALFWGAQLEASSFPTSYIPTTSSSATRAADVATIGSVTGLDYPLTLWAEWEYTGTDSTTPNGGRVLLSVTDGTVANRFQLYNLSGAAGALVQVASSSTLAMGVAGTIDVGVVSKVAAAAGTNDGRCSVGGTLATPDASGAVPSAPSTIGLGNTASGAQFTGYLRKAAIFPEAKADAALEAMTA